MPNLIKNAIVPNDNGYLIFGKWAMKKHNTNLYKVICNGNICGDFGSAKSALSWCIAEKYGQHQLSLDIRRLEDQRLIMSADIEVRTILADKMKTQLCWETASYKLEHKKDQLNQIESQLDKCVNLAKYWQIRGFNNETVRTGRTTS